MNGDGRMDVVTANSKPAIGAAGAGKFLSAMRDNPLRAARDVVPEAAASNTR